MQRTFHCRFQMAPCTSQQWKLGYREPVDKGKWVEISRQTRSLLVYTWYRDSILKPLVRPDILSAIQELRPGTSLRTSTILNSMIHVVFLDSL
jgi:hypothetical protein